MAFFCEKSYNPSMEYLSKSVLETEKIAAELAQKIFLQQTQNKATVVALEGELGAGKTTFVKAFAKALGVKEKLSSPTFVIMRSYQLSTASYQLLVHIDAYRLDGGEELELLGIDDIFTGPENIVLIEWAERVADILPAKHLTIHIDHISENERKIILIQ